MSYPQAKQQGAQIFQTAINAIAAELSSKQVRRGAGLVDHLGRPISSAFYHQIQRRGAQRSGSLKNWIPKRIFSDQQQALEREQLVDRSIDLFNNDPHAAGAVDTFASTIIGGGLQPYPNFTSEDLGLEKNDKDPANDVKRQLRRIVKTWSPFADAGERLTFGGLQFLAMQQIVSMGECLFLLPMIDDSIRPYSLALQAINPLRLMTPTDKKDSNISDGIELGEYGQPMAYWIKRAERRKGQLPDTSANFVRIPARIGHRLNVIHIFYHTGSEQIRGVPWFAPAIKFFRDMNDYLDAELVANIVTAAFSMFIEVEDVEPDYPSLAMADITETGYKSDGSTKQTRYEELIPGLISYLNKGEKPFVVSHNRPGATFEPFIRIIEKSIALSVNMPHPVLFKDFQGMNFASYRSAMLEAWRIFKSRRQWFGQGFCQGPYRMLAEEAYLKGDLEVDNFYPRIWALTSCDWIGPPKGQIEPVKEIQADEKEHSMRIKSRRVIALERGYDYDAMIDQIDEEEADLTERGINLQQAEESAGGGQDMQDMIDETKETIEDGS